VEILEDTGEVRVVGGGEGAHGDVDGPAGGAERGGGEGGDGTLCI
jgi:hypothetical protein